MLRAYYLEQLQECFPSLEGREKATVRFKNICNTLLAYGYTRILREVREMERAAIEAKPESLQTSREWANLNKLTTAINLLREVLQ